MKVKGKSELEEIAKKYHDLLAQELLFCEMIYVLSEIAKRISINMLQGEKEDDRKT